MKPKHILFIFTDQQRADTIGATGNQDIITPALDGLAGESYVFHKCYTPSPVCIPARLSLLSGQYPARTGNNNLDNARTYQGDGFYARFTKAGWNTCAIGKMHHVWDPYGPLGFKTRITQEEMAHPDDDYTKWLHQSPYQHIYDYSGQRSEMYYMPQISPLPAEAHPTQWIGDRSVEFIQKSDPAQPMFLMSSFIHPHPPFAPPAPWNKMYRTPIRRAFIPKDPETYLDLLRNGHYLPAEGISMRCLELLTAYYYACISFVDYQISRILQALKDKGMYEDTLIVFSSDHGEMLGDFNSMGKKTVLDASCRIPLLLHLPRQTKLVERYDPCSLVDLAPTLLSYAGIAYEAEDYDGIDLLASRHEFVFSQYGSGTVGEWMIATDRDKLIYSAIGNRYFYFDSFPEAEDKYSAASPRVQLLKERLDGYMESDCCDSEETAPAVSPGRAEPLSFYSQIADHAFTMKEEYARMPKGYPITLVDPKW